MRFRLTLQNWLPHTCSLGKIVLRSLNGVFVVKSLNAVNSITLFPKCLLEEDKQFQFITVFFPIWNKWAQDQTVSQQKPSISILTQQVIFNRFNRFLFNRFQYPSCTLTSGLLPINVLQLELVMTLHFLPSLTLLLVLLLNISVSGLPLVSWKLSAFCLFVQLFRLSYDFHNLNFEHSHLIPNFLRKHRNIAPVTLMKKQTNQSIKQHSYNSERQRDIHSWIKEWHNCTCHSFLFS